MIDHSALRRAVSEYVTTIVGTYGIGEMLYRLTDHAVEALGIAGAGVSVGDAEGRLRFVAATDEDVSRVEADQIDTQQGPCHEAFASGKLVAVTDLATTADRWPDYAPAAIRHGCQAVLGVPMQLEDLPIGAINLYQHAPHEWSDEELETASLFADMAAGYVANLRELANTRQLAQQLQQALDSRIIIEQAKGALARQHRIDLNQAFERLRRHARSRQRKVHDVARDIVDGRLEL